MYGKRTFTGEIINHENSEEYGSFVVAKFLPGGWSRKEQEWGIPEDWFIRAGHTILEVGTEFQAEIQPRIGSGEPSIVQILPPL